MSGLLQAGEKSSRLTARRSVDLVLDKEIKRGEKSSKERRAQKLSVSHSGWVRFGAQGNTSNGPGYGGDKVGNHENVVPIMVVGGCHIGPATAGKGSEDADSKDELGESRVWAGGQEIPHAYQQEARACSNVQCLLLLANGWLVNDGRKLTRSDCNEDLEDGSLGKAVTDGGRDRREPFDRVALQVLVRAC